jgi:hypothetical protein
MEEAAYQPEETTPVPNLEYVNTCHKAQYTHDYVMQCTNPVYFSGNKAGSQNAIALVLE